MSDLKTYIRNTPVDRRGEFAKQCGCTLQHLRFVAYRAKKPSIELAINIERATGGEIPARNLLPEHASMWDSIIIKPLAMADGKAAKKSAAIK